MVILKYNALKCYLSRLLNFLAFLLILRLRGAPYSTLFLLLLCIEINFTSLKPIVAESFVIHVLQVKKLSVEDTR